MKLKATSRAHSYIGSFPLDRQTKTPVNRSYNLLNNQPRLNHRNGYLLVSSVLISLKDSDEPKQITLSS